MHHPAELVRSLNPNEKAQNAKTSDENETIHIFLHSQFIIAKSLDQVCWLTSTHIWIISTVMFHRRHPLRHCGSARSATTTIWLTISYIVRLLIRLKLTSPQKWGEKHLAARQSTQIFRGVAVATHWGMPTKKKRTFNTAIPRIWIRITPLNRYCWTHYR